MPAGLETPVRRSRAVTLVEVLLVAVIIAILTTLATPRFLNALCRQRVEAAARRIIVDLTLAREEARSSGVSQEVSFDPASGRYRLAARSHLDHAAAEYEVALCDEPYRVVLSAASFGGDRTLVFDMYGRPDSGGSVVVRIGKHVRTVSVHPDTGKASAP